MNRINLLNSTYTIFAVSSQKSIRNVTGFVRYSLHFFALYGICINASSATRMLKNKAEITSFYRADFILQKSLVSYTSFHYPVSDNTVLPEVWLPLWNTLELEFYFSLQERCYQEQLVNRFALDMNMLPIYSKPFWSFATIVWSLFMIFSPHTTTCTTWHCIFHFTVITSVWETRYD